MNEPKFCNPRSNQPPASPRTSPLTPSPPPTYTAQGNHGGRRGGLRRRPLRARGDPVRRGPGQARAAILRGQGILADDHDAPRGQARAGTRQGQAPSRRHRQDRPESRARQDQLRTAKGQGGGGAKAQRGDGVEALQAPGPKRRRRREHRGTPGSIAQILRDGAHARADLDHRIRPEDGQDGGPAGCADGVSAAVGRRRQRRVVQG